MAGEVTDWKPDLPIVDKLDYVDSPFFSACFKVQVLEKKTTPFCELEIVFNPLFGNMMFIDGEIQISQADYESYHAAMWEAADMPWNPRVLVVGDGDGGFTKYAAGAKSIDIIERDREVVAAGETYFGAEWDKVNLHEKDLTEFRPSHPYDVAMLAIDDGFNMALDLEKQLDRVASWLMPGRKLIAQVGSDLDPKYPAIIHRYRQWAKSRRLRWNQVKSYVGCYFCHENFFIAEVD